MKVILQQDVKSLGEMGDIVRVKDGYGRNFLIPRGLAIIANERNTRQLQHLQKVAAEKADKERAESQELAKQIEATPLSFIVAASEEDDKIFGSVTNRDIAQKLAENSINVERKNIILPEPIRSLGKFDVKVSLKRGVTATVSVLVQR